MGADKSVRVELRGVRELNRAFKQVDLALPKELRKEFRAVAQLIRDRAAGKAGRPGRVLKVRAGQSGAGIAFPAGGTWNRSSAHDPNDFWPWWDFGGSTGRGHQPGAGGSGAIKREWTGGAGGRFLYPTIGESKGEIGAAADDAIEHVVKRAGFDTKGRADA